ncbi:MAG: carbohydrate ABC transporter permease [Chloroflexi bacterium]|nr:carbohydrate ABC transporter permease [Chloroflexota bacterium]
MATIKMTTRRPVRIGRTVEGILFYGAVVLFLLIILLPIYYIFLTAFAAGDQLFTKPLNYLPQTFGIIDRLNVVFAGLPIWQYLANTVFLATMSTVIALALCFLAAYSIARLQFPGANLVLIILLLSTMLPGVATVIPLFQMFQGLKLMNTLHGLLLLYVSPLLPVTTWVLVSFIKQVPAEIEDAAKVDGAGFFAMMWQIVLPMIKPGFAVMFVVNFIAGWNEFFTPLIFARGAASKTITMALGEAQTIGSSNQFYQNWGNMSAVAILVTVPVFIITLVFQRQIIEGLTAGAIK